MSEKLPTNSQISHYRVVSKIGAGGMGEVYLAQDTKLDRKVALKILPADFSADETRMSRFIREAKSVSALNHPNILTIHEIGEDSSQHYIATEFIAGKTLRELLQDGPLPLLQSLETACQIGAALNAAHQAGIVHRDIKPENVMVRADGLVKVLDFGLAKLTGGASDPDSETRIQSETQPGMIIGTVAYMSPQQARGKAVDARTDVWSLGVVIYEMLTGLQPFRGETMTDTLANILHTCPEPLNIVPPDLAQIVSKMLGKKLEARYATINDVVVELKYLQRRIEFETELDRKSSLNKRTEDKTVMKPSTFSGPAIDSASARADEGFWVAVLPFKVRDEDPAVAVLADGLSEEIVTGLSRFRYLSVVTSTSAVRLKNETEDVRSVGAKLGTRYVLQGSIRQGGSVIRVSARLVDTETGAQLWSETYNRDLQTSTIFAVQDDVAGRIVATVADSYGVLVHSMRAAIQKKDDADLTPVEWQFQYFAYREQITPVAHATLKSRLQRVAERNVEQSDVWACLAQIYVDEYAFGFQGDATSLARALAAGRRAVELDRANQFALVALAQVHFFRRDLAAFGPAAERGMALNPLNTDALGILGLQIVHTGHFERGTAIVLRAMELNPNHAGWMHFAPLWNHFHKGEYEEALECANRVDVPGLFWPYLVMASACGHLGRRAEADAAVRDLLALDPEFAAHVRSNVESWHFASGLLDPLLEGLRIAGLEISGEEPTSRSSPRLASSETRADEGFWIAVLPLKFTGSNTKVASLAEGLSEEIVTGLSRFSYLRVIACSSTLRYASETSDVRTVGQALGARYVMEGSLRVAGSLLRLSVQLVDSSTGAHLWAETYDRSFNSEEIFALQDDLVPRIVSTVADQYGALVHSMSESLRGRRAGQYSAHEAVLRAFGYWERMTPEEHAEVRDILEAAVAVAPDHSDCLAELAMIYWHEYAFGYNLEPDPLGRARAAAQRAVASAPTSHFAHCALATGLFFQKDYLAFRPVAERALALNRMDSSTAAILGNMIAYAGDWEYGLGVVERAIDLNPHHAGWYHYVAFCDAYRKRDYRGALASALKVNMPTYHWPQVYLAAVYGQLGEQQRAQAALRELHALVPNFGAMAREGFGKWLDDELTEHLIDGLRKAGLEIASEKEEAHHVSREERAALTSAFSSSGSFSRPAIVVLPFVNRSPDPENEYFSDGLTEEIIADLSGINALRVISRNSSMTLKGTTKDTLTVAKELGVSHVVSGSVRKVGDDLRVNAELIEVVSDTPLWSDKYSGTMANVFGIQEEIAQKIVSALHVRLTDAEKQQAIDRPIQDTVAYDCYLRARQEMYRWTPESMDRADSLVDQALGIVGDNALLLATKGQIHWSKVNVLIDPDERHLDLAADCARRALAIDENEYLAIFVRGIVAGLRGDTVSALRDIYRAHQLRPGDPNVLTELCRFANSSGIDVDDYVKELVAMDPLTPVTWCVVACNHMENGRIADSVPAARRIVELSPGPSPAHIFASSALAMAGLRDEAIKVATIVGQRLPGTLHGSWASFLRYAFAADGARACEAMTPVLEKGAALVDLVSYNLATGYSLIGQNDESLKWIHVAMNRGFINYPFLAKYDQLLTNVRSDPRFAELMKEVKKRWETLAQNLPGNLKAQRFIESHEVDEASKATAANRTPKASAVPNFDNRTAIVDIAASPRHLVSQSPSIAVLPFVNISNDTDNEYFCDGLAEELLNALSKIETLRVAARTSAFSFKRREIDIREIGKKLNVGAVLEGSVRKAGNRVRIAAQLVNIADGYQLWSEKYDRRLEDIFDIQDEISLSIVAALKVKLLGAEKANLTKRYTGNTEAYQLYLKGRFFVNQRTSESLRKAIQYFNEAISVDPNYALGYAGLTDAYLVFGVPDAVTEALAPQDALPKARAAGEKALELDKSVAEIYPSLAHAKWKARDWVGAESDYKRGIELNPNYPIAHFYYAVYLASLGRHDEAVKEITRAQELDPLSLPVNASVTYVLYFCRRYDEAIAAGKKTLELDLAFPLTHQRLGLSYIQKQMYREAIAEFQQAVNNSNRAPQPLISLGHAYALAGNKVEAENVLSELKEKSQGRYVSPYGVATIYLGLGDIEQAFHWLDKAYDEQNTELTFLRVDPRLDPLRDDVRFQKLLNKVGFPFEPKPAQSSSAVNT